MKVALIGDIHGNLPALEAVLEDAHRRNVESIWNIGDFVGYGPFPDEVVKRLHQEQALSIIGNYDSKALEVKRKKKKWQDSKSRDKTLAFEWAYDNLSESSRDYLLSLPEEMRLEVEGKKVLLTHGSPESDKEHLLPDTPEERFRELAEKSNADIIIFGHSHQPFKRKVAGVWFINTGSVGRPDDGDPRACYAIMWVKYRYFRVDHYRIEYDVDRTAEKIREQGLPESFAQMFLQGCSLNSIIETSEPLQDSEVKQLAGSERMDDETLKSIQHLAETCRYEVGHTHQVTRLALRLFDELSKVHHLGAEERFWLHAAALLHDIGWIEGQKGHHKTALRIILKTPILTFDHTQRLIIGSIVRYHRKALPKKKHAHFSALMPPQRKVVSMLAGILRVADGLDRTHRNLVEDVSCEVTPDQIILKCLVRRPAEVERLTAMKKGDLLEKIFNVSLTIVCDQS
jgi:putative phosphoesterase